MQQTFNHNGFIITLHTNQPLQQGLGDRLASVLNRFGIHAWKGCGCAKRRQRLNRFGWQVLSLFKWLL